MNIHFDFFNDLVKIPKNVNENAISILTPLSMTVAQIKNYSKRNMSIISLKCAFQSKFLNFL